MIENPTPEQQEYAEQIFNTFMDSMFVTTDRGLCAGPMSPQAAAKMCQDYEDRQKAEGLPLDNARLASLTDVIIAGCAAIASGLHATATAV